MGRITCCWFLCVLLHVPALASYDEKAAWEALALRNQGEFDKATQALETLIEQSSATLEQQERRNLEFEIERIRRIRKDYQLTRDRLLEQLQRRVEDFTSEELETHEREGRLDVQTIDGQKLYVNSSASNLILRVPELRLRLKTRKPDTMYRRLYNQMLHVQKARELTSSSLLLPQDYAVTYTLLVQPNAVSAGQVVRCWLPFVRSYPHHTDIHLLASTPSRYLLSPPEYPHRTVYLERRAKQDHATTFSISFIYRSWARAMEVDPSRIQPYRTDNPDYSYYLGEQKPHIDLGNDELKRAATEIVGGETNPYLAAKRIYDWIATNTIYQYAREYSTLDNLSHYTFSRRAGDCGQHGMLFITLCRMNGIPARWTTGWETFNTRGHNMHDWCEFFVEPYGWLPADPDMAVNLLNHAHDELTSAQQRRLSDWLFGNMDHYRLTVNSDFGAQLFPPKVDFRSETVDFQRGEVESEGKNLYFDQWDYSMKIEQISAEQAQQIAARFVPPPPADALPLHGFAEGVTTEPLRLPKASDPATTSSAELLSTGTVQLDEPTSSTNAPRLGPAGAAGGETSPTVHTATPITTQTESVSSETSGVPAADRATTATPE